MNNSVNYSSFTDLLLTSDDEFESYGLSSQHHLAYLDGDFDMNSAEVAASFRDVDKWLDE